MWNSPQQATTRSRWMALSNNNGGARPYDPQPWVKQKQNLRDKQWTISYVFSAVLNDVVCCFCCFERCRMLFLLFWTMSYVVYAVSNNVVCCMLFLRFRTMSYVVSAVSNNVVSCFCCFVQCRMFSLRFRTMLYVFSAVSNDVVYLKSRNKNLRDKQCRVICFCGFELCCKL